MPWQPITPPPDSCYDDPSLLDAPDPRLRVISTPVKTIEDGLRTPIADMFETMYDAPGIGPAV